MSSANTPSLVKPSANSLRTHLSISSLLLLSFTLLPRFSRYFFNTPIISQRSSSDRPESPFLTPITADPLCTMVCTAMGSLATMYVWGNQLQRSIFGKIPWTWARFRDVLVTILIASVAFMIVLLALGAPLDSFLPHTFLLAVHFTSLIILPFVKCYGLPPLDDSGIIARHRLRRLFCEFNPQSPMERALVGTNTGIVIGAWAGASALALDWDRPWQSYPLTPVLGSILGFMIGGMVSCG